MAKNNSPKSEKLLDLLSKSLNDKFGDSFVTVYKEAFDVPRISTGILALDKAIGGGVALGRMTELYGKSASGKTTVVISVMAQAQKQFPNKTVVYIDAEHALDTLWAVKLGINLERFIHIQPETAEQGFLAIEEFIKTGEVSVIALDSVPASLPQIALEGNIGDANIGAQARLIAQCLPRIEIKLAREKDPPAILLINQKRANLQSRGGFQGFEPTKTTGGMSFQHYMTTRLDIARIGTLKDSLDDEVGQEVLVHVTKHKITPGPGAKITFHIVNRKGVDTEQELLDMALESGEILKSGSWFVMPDGSKVQGQEQAKEWIKTKRTV
jgi:recombination protein RecA